MTSLKRLGRHCLAAATLAGLCVLGFGRGVSQPAAAPSCQISGVDRVVAIGDVHGAHDSLVRILRVTGLIDSSDRWSGGAAHLVQLGDIVDRGPDSRKVLDLVRRLEKEAARAGGRVHVLLGNHEVMRMLGDMRYVVPGEYQAFATSDSSTLRNKYLQSMGVPPSDETFNKTPLGMVEMRLAFGRDGSYGSWLRDLDVVVNINGVVFLHGAISPAVAAMSCDEINSTVRRELNKDLDKTRAAPLMSLAAREDGPLWYRGLAQDPDTAAPQVEDTLAKQHAKAIVVAHTVQPTGRMLTRFGGNVVVIDTGMQSGYVASGRPSALEIRQGVFTAIYEDSREAVRDLTKPAVPPATQPPPSEPSPAQPPAAEASPPAETPPQAEPPK